MRTAEMVASAAVDRSLSPTKHLRNPISRAQVETIVSRAVAVMGIVFALQTIPTLLAQVPKDNPVWTATVVPVISASLIVALIASLSDRWVWQAHSLVAVLYIVALLSWPFSVTDLRAVPTDNNWLYYLLTVATGTAAIGFSRAIATTYLFVVPIMYGLIRLTPAGGGSTWQKATLDSVYSIILGAAVMMIITMLRQAAASVDSAQATALERYSFAVRQHATEVERVQVDSIVHDSVLTTLLSAARAYTPEAKTLAATMAGNAIGHLREAALVVPDDGSTVRIDAVARRIADAANTIGARFEMRTRLIGARTMPVHAGEAVYSAAVQAMVNSLQHAGPADSVSRWLSIREVAPTGIEIEIGDSGVGFAVTDVPLERLGLRVSIVDRIANAGGATEVESAPGEGTVVTIRWPRDAQQALHMTRADPR
jgi:signal transduction histidine kinase